MARRYNDDLVHLDAARQANALRAIQRALALDGDRQEFRDNETDAGNGDDRLGEDIFEAIDGLLASDLVDEGLLLGIGEAQKLVEARKARIERRRDARRAAIEQALAILEIKSLERPTATITLANRPPKLTIVDESQVPSSFFKMTPSLDRKALRAALEREGAVPGARLEDGIMSLTVRWR